MFSSLACLGLVQEKKKGDGYCAFFYQLTFVSLIISYLRSADAADDHGMVVFGFLVYVPVFTLIIQVVIYLVHKLSCNLKSRYSSV